MAELTPSQPAGSAARADGDSIAFEAAEDVEAGQPVAINEDGTIGGASAEDFVLGSPQRDIDEGDSDTLNIHGAVVYQATDDVVPGPVQADGGEGALVPADDGEDSNLMALTPADGGRALISRL